MLLLLLLLFCQTGSPTAGSCGLWFWGRSCSSLKFFRGKYDVLRFVLVPRLGLRRELDNLLCFFYKAKLKILLQLLPGRKHAGWGAMHDAPGETTSRRRGKLSGRCPWGDNTALPATHPVIRGRHRVKILGRVTFWVDFGLLLVNFDRQFWPKVNKTSPKADSKLTAYKCSMGVGSWEGEKSVAEMKVFSLYRDCSMLRQPSDLQTRKTRRNSEPTKSVQTPQNFPRKQFWELLRDQEEAPNRPFLSGFSAKQNKENKRPSPKHIDNSVPDYLRLLFLPMRFPIFLFTTKKWASK